ncbi:Fic family protein [Patescibacteria group bacterium]|nr:Fic family protein [Patescibacteria group bacterium]
MIKKPPKWKDFLTQNLFQRALKSEDLQSLIKKAEKDYVYWDKFKYYPIPNGFSAEEAWAFLKFSRLTNRDKTPVKDKDGNVFGFLVTKTMYQELSHIDSNTSGFLSTEWGKPNKSKKNQMIISGLSEEAIASSQIEGASTSRKVAKEMILLERKPKTKDEKMIVNNYQVMQRLEDLKELELSKEMLLEIQGIITRDTMDDPYDSGRFRNDEDDINVVDSSRNEIIFTPPREEIFKKELDRLIKFANKDEDDEGFIHPVIKASIIHFWFSYLHPFVDGNGRTARALFYWYLLRKNYWLFQYLSVSRAIKLSRVQYDDSFLKTEYDDNDLTYFIFYQLKVVKKAMDDFISHYEKKLVEDKKILLIKSKLKQYNERQLSLLTFLNKNSKDVIDIKRHQAKYQVAYQTARADLMKLSEDELIAQILDGRKYIYIANTKAIRDLFNTKCGSAS